MKKLLFTILLIISVQVVFAQSNWKLSGNSGTSAGDFLGTTDNRPLIFRTDNIERGRLQAGGTWRFGTSADHTRIDVNGNLTFGGTSTYLVDGNSYVFRYQGSPNYGLYFNSTVPRYEFRNSSATPVFHVNANNGNGEFSGTLKVGAYTFPSVDGLNGQVLKTNGSGVLAWSDDLNGGGGANLFLSNLSSPTAVNQSLLPEVTNSIDIGSSSFSWKDIYANGALHLNGQKFLSNPGNQNIPIGAGALNSNTTGIANIAVGEESLFGNTTGAANVGVGHQSLLNNTTGNENTGLGFNTLRSNISGNQNVALGAYALYSNTTGAGNVAIGGALESNIDGNSNVAIGTWSLIYSTSSYYNVGVGIAALQMNTDGWQNTAVGYEVNRFNTSGLRNAAFGAESLNSNVTGNYNSVLGYGADVTAPDLTNATAIGNSALVDASDKVRIGNTIVSSIGGEVSWTTFSDARYKRNIKENVPGLDFINSLRPITYTVDIDALNGHYPKNKKPELPSMSNSKIKGQGFDEEAALQKVNARIKQSEEEATKIVYTGFAAQEVEAAAKKLNYDFSGVDKPKTENGLYGLRYSDFVVPMVKAIQETSKQMEEKDQKIAELTTRIEKLERLLLTNGKISTQNISIGNEALLEQNAPNPFTNGTTIRYQLPERFSSAQIAVTDNSGKTLKQVSLAGAGKGSLNIDASVLAAGTYNYSLYIDGRLIATKQMILTK